MLSRKKLLKGLELSRQNLGDKKLSSCFVDPSFFYSLAAYVCSASLGQALMDGYFGKITMSLGI